MKIEEIPGDAEGGPFYFLRPETVGEKAIFALAATREHALEFRSASGDHRFELMIDPFPDAETQHVRPAIWAPKPDALADLIGPASDPGPAKAERSCDTCRHGSRCGVQTRKDCGGRYALWQPHSD